MAKFLEYQGKEWLAKGGMPVPKGRVASSPEEAEEAARWIGGPVAVKGQVQAGGRGKAGLIKVVKDAESAKATAKTLFESEHNVRMLLVEEAVDIDREIYLSITVDPVESKIMLIGCAEGGVEIEKLAATDPDKIVTVRVDIAEGLGGYHVNNLTYGMGLSGDLGKQVGAVVRGLYKTFRAYDAQLAEINPLFITKDGKAIAGDGKLIIDDNSVWRQPSYPLTRDYFDSEVEFEAAQEGIPYLQFNGDIALMCAGAGLTTTVFDLINDAGGHPATYVEFGGAIHGVINRRVGIHGVEGAPHFRRPGIEATDVALIKYLACRLIFRAVQRSRRLMGQQRLLDVGGQLRPQPGRSL